MHHLIPQTLPKILLGLLLASPITLCGASGECEKLIRQAECLMESGDYAEACDVYYKAWEELLGQRQPKEDIIQRTRFSLAAATLAADRYSETIALFQGMDKKALLPGELLLIAKAYQKTGKPEAALPFLHYYLDHNSQKPDDEARWEIGKAYFQLQNYPKAKASFSTLQTNSPFYILSQLYLARIAIAENLYNEAELRLKKLQGNLPSADPIKYEWAYLLGELSEKQGRYQEAASYFEQAIPTHNEKQAAWYQSTLDHLSRCYLKLAEEQKSYLEKAEGVLKKRAATFPSEEVYLLLGRCYLSKGQTCHDAEALKQVETLLSQRGILTSPDALGDALLLRAQAAPTYEKRDELYRQLIQEIPRQNPRYAQGWYYKGRHDLEEGQALLQQGSPLAAKNFSQAMTAFQTAFQASAKENPAFAQESARLYIQTALILDTQDALSQALSFLQTMTARDSQPDKEEFIYLKGLVASRLANTNPTAYLTLAEQSWQQTLLQFPKGKWAPAAQFSLGVLALQQQEVAKAEDLFHQVTSLYPDSPFAGDGWFFVSRCAEMQLKDGQYVSDCRRQVFEKYPTSSYAAEAYLTCYLYGDYLQEDPTPIQHLEKMPQLYPLSPFVIMAHYLIGLHWKKDVSTQEGKVVRKRNLQKSIEAFQEAESTFDSLNAKGLIPSDNLSYFIAIRYRAILERALANLAIAWDSKGTKHHIYLEYATDLLERAVHDFENPSHPLTSILSRRELYVPLQEESEYSLAQAYLKAQNDDKAQKVLTGMLDKYQRANITRGYFLSRVWYDLGLIKMKKQEFTAALESFKQAEDCGKGNVLSADQKLDLWIQQSQCHRSMNQLETAMRILSQVINEDAVSGLRLKAMYLRSEIYAEQGRRELAYKQLEALANKGGEWSAKAKEKLEQDYRY